MPRIGLVLAHVELAKAEADGHRRRDRQGRRLCRRRDRASSCSRSSSLVVGGSLFLGEWLLGSMGWGVLHGVLLFIAIAIACSLRAVGMSGRRIGVSLLLGIVVGGRRRR